MVELQTPEGEKIDGVASDIGLTGMFVCIPCALDIGAPVDVRVRLPGMDAKAQIPATVRWCKSDGVGLQFGVMGARETHGVVEIIEQVRGAQAASG